MAKYTHLDPFLSPDQADAMQRIAESFGSFGTYADEASSEGLGEQLPQRFDVGLHYVSAGIDGKGNKAMDNGSCRRPARPWLSTVGLNCAIQSPGRPIVLAARSRRHYGGRGVIT